MIRFHSMRPRLQWYGLLSTTLIFCTLALSNSTEVLAQSDAKTDGKDTLSVPELIAIKSRWPNLAAIKAVIVVEGRLGSRSETALRMRNCEIRFRAQPNNKLPPIARKTENVILAGYLVKERSKYAFIIQSLKAQPSDLEALRTKRLTLPIKDFSPWYTAARWASERAAFYKDDKLLQSSRGLAAEAIQRERRSLPADDGAGVLKLASKAAMWELPKAVTQELKHEAYRLLWESCRDKGMPTFTELHPQLIRELNGAQTAFKEFPVKLANAYLKNANETYRTAPTETRTVLHRLFYLSVMQHQIERNAKADGSNGSVIAASLEKQLPDLPGRAEFHRDRELAYRVKNVTTAGRDEVVALAALLSKRNKPAKATAVLKSWLAAQEPVLRKEGATGLIRLSDDVDRLLKDRQRAIRLLKEADRLTPNLDSVASRMQRFGYRRHGNAWLTNAAFAKIPVAPPRKELRNGQIANGLSPAEVRKIVAGTPTSVMRSASRTSVSEVWVYFQPDRTRLVVHFSRKQGEPRSRLQVTRTFRISDSP